MPVFRVDKSRDFTVVANCVFKDRSLSAKAKGILVEMLSLPESWDYTLKGLTTLFSDGIDSIRQGINELEKHGYIVRERKREKETLKVGLAGWSMSFTRPRTSFGGKIRLHSLWKTSLLNRQNL